MGMATCYGDLKSEIRQIPLTMSDDAESDPMLWRDLDSSLSAMLSYDLYYLKNLPLSVGQPFHSNYSIISNTIRPYILT